MCVQRRYDEAPHLDSLGVAVGNTLLFINPGCARVHAAVLRGCLRAQPARLVVSVVCLKIVIQL